MNVSYGTGLGQQGIIEQWHNGTKMALDVGGLMAYVTKRYENNDDAAMRKKTLSTYTDNDKNISKYTMVKQECVLVTAYIDNDTIHGLDWSWADDQTAARNEEKCFNSRRVTNVGRR